jgi:uncharacterized protein (DUF2336 family)
MQCVLFVSRVSFVRSEILQPVSDDGSLRKSDRLFRAAVSGYCSLTRANARDAAQLDDLTLPLLPLVSDETKRFAAAALSESMPAPPALLRRLADCPVPISAPLLLRSHALADIDLIGLIGRNGIAHARAIARRPRLNPNIAALINALGIAAEAEVEGEAAASAAVQPTAAPAGIREARPALARGVAEEETREQLRAMMKPAAPAAPEAPLAPPDWVTAHAAYPRMVATGLTGMAALFHTAIADAFDMSFKSARRMAEIEQGERLAIALKAAGLTTAEAFLVAALAFPPRFGSTAAIRAFVEAYRALDIDRARRELCAWRERDGGPVRVRRPAEPANSDEAPIAAPRKLLKAS